MQSQTLLDAFYNLKKKIVELPVSDKTTKTLMESLVLLERQLTIKDEVPSLEEIDLVLNEHREPSKGAGPSKAMQIFIKNEQRLNAIRMDWIIAYGKVCNARCDLSEAEAEEKRLSDLYLKYMD